MSRHGRAKQYGPEPSAAVYTKPPPPVHGNTFNGRAHHHYQQLQQQQQQQQFYGTQQQLQQQQPNVVGVVRPLSGNHYLHHSLPRNAWSADRHSLAAGESSSNSSNERTYTASRRSKHHRVYNSYRQSSSRRALHHHMDGGGATTDPDALSSVTTAGAKYDRQQQQQHHQSQYQLHQLQHQNHWPSTELPSSSVVGAPPPPPPPPPPLPLQQGTAAQYQQLPPLLPPQNSASTVAVNRQPAATAAGLPTAASTGGGALALRHHQQPSTLLQFPSCDVAVDACGGHCPRFENFCHFCLLVFYFVGITVGFLLILASVVSSRDPRFMYIGGLVLPVSMFLMAVQCRVRLDANRRKRHRQLLNGRIHHRSNNVTTINGGAGGANGAGQPIVLPSAAETIPLQNIMAVGSGSSVGDNATLRRQFHGNVYQYVGQVDDESNYDVHHYETTSDVQQIEGVPWWRREDNRSYHGRTTHQ